jgi:hypothetical protein
MGLFSTLATSGVAASSSTVPTVIQLYTSEPVLLDSTAKVTGYTAMTYQAVQVGSSEEEPKNKHQNPDLGVWSCRVQKTTNSSPLIDSLLSKLKAKADVNTFCWTVDLTDETKVESDLTLLQQATVRYLIENPPSTEEERSTATTSLYQLQATQFGLAPEDKSQTAKNLSESTQDVKTTVMICAVLPPVQDDNSETNYRTKQAKALVIYHLRKFAAAINSSLVFCSKQAPAEKQTEEAVTQAHSTVDFDKLSQLWRDLANDQPVWITADAAPPEESPSPDEGAETTDFHYSTPIYGPTRHQDDLIETLLLRNAHCTGHWDAAKDSLWVALSTPAPPAEDAAAPPGGDEGWLGQLRESIVSAEPVKPAVPASEKPKEQSPKKDAAVSSFFESLLKNP